MAFIYDESGTIITDEAGIGIADEAGSGVSVGSISLSLSVNAASVNTAGNATAIISKQD